MNFVLKMTPQLYNYLQWRCRTNWHPKYLKYIDDWISNITDTQLEYFIRECYNLINNGKYHI